MSIVRRGRPAAGTRLARVDEANLVLDHAGQVNVFLVAGLLAPGGFVGKGGPDLGALRRVVADRVVGLPALRVVPRRSGRGHRWVDTAPELDHHVRLASAVTGIAGLQGLCGDLMSIPLDLDKPLWELLVVPLASGGRLGIVLRIHHAIADGVTAADIVQRLFDPGAPTAVSPDRASTERRAPSPRGPLPALHRIAFGIHRVLLTLRASGVGPTVLLGERSPGRAVVFLDADLERLAHLARAAGATINDALLAAMSSGYRAALPAAGEPVPDRLTVSVPVALPASRRRSDAAANRVGVVLVRLPLGEPDADRRLRLIAEQTGIEKVRTREQGTLELTRGPMGARIMDRLAQRQHLVAGFVTDVPGPVGTLRLAGSRLEALWPVSVLAANVRLGVAAVSSAGRLWCSVQFDDEGVPGAEFAKAMDDELRRLSGAP